MLFSRLEGFLLRIKSLPRFLSAYGRGRGVSFGLSGSETALRCSWGGAEEGSAGGPVDGGGGLGALALTDSPDWPGDWDEDESVGIKAGVKFRQYSLGK